MNLTTLGELFFMVAFWYHRELNKESVARQKEKLRVNNSHWTTNLCNNDEADGLFF